MIVHIISLTFWSSSCKVIFRELNNLILGNEYNIQLPSFEQGINIIRFSLIAKDVISLLWYDNIFDRLQLYFFSGFITKKKKIPNLFPHTTNVSDSSIIIFVIGDISLVEYKYVVLFESFCFTL